jgi:hypothetical protein
MTQFNKDELDELISGYLDGRLSKRHHTEVDRLIRHDPEFLNEFIRIKKQKELLGAMPTASAPDVVFENLKRLIDDKYSAKQVTRQTAEGSRHLRTRRYLSAAAMFALLGVLAIILFNIIIPISPRSTTVKIAANLTGPKTSAETSTKVKKDDFADNVLIGAYPINASIELVSSDVITVNGAIEKAIFGNDLLEYTVPGRYDNMSTYQLTCSPDRVIAFLTDLQAVWNKCSDTRLIVHGKNVTSNVVIDDVSPAEVAALYRHDPGGDHIRYAKQMAGFKNIVKSMPLEGAFGSVQFDSAKLARELPTVKPVLTTGANEPAEKQPSDNSQNAILTITVTGP